MSKINFLLNREVAQSKAYNNLLPVIFGYFLVEQNNQDKIYFISNSVILPYTKDDHVIIIENPFNSKLIRIQ